MVRREEPKTKPELEKLLSLDELAELLGISREAARTCYLRDQLPVVSVGPKMKRFRPSDVARWVSDNTMLAEAI